jgi:hypothetical protein
MTAIDYVVRYQEHLSGKSYEELLAGFEEAVADAESGQFARVFQAAAGSEHSRETWEAPLKPLLGPSGFMHVFSVDFGALAGWYGVSAKASIMSRFGDPEVDAVARELDTKVVTFLTELAGAEA